MATGVAARPMGVNQQEFSLILFGDPADLSQGHLESLCLRYRVGIEQGMHGRIRGQERKSVEDLEAAEGDASSLADSPGTQGRLVDQLQSQSRLDSRGRLLRPAAQQVPRAQPEVFRDQQP